MTGFGLALISVSLLLFVYDPATVVALTTGLSVRINMAMSSTSATSWVVRSSRAPSL